MERDALSNSHAFLNELTHKTLNGADVTPKDAKRIYALRTQEEIVVLMAHANMLRSHFKGAQIDLCAVVNVKSGRCTEDCIFCAQSAHHRTEIKTYPLLDTEAVLTRARQAQENGAKRIGMVTSGKGISSGREFESLCTTIEAIAKESDLVPCASLGVLGGEQMLRLREAGLKRYHHNLETAESHFPKVCSTHSFGERVQTILAAQQAGFETCSGGIMGLGETPEQRIELAFTLRDLRVDSVPLNFLNPLSGTPAETYPLLPPLEIVKIIALFRFVLPQKDIRICGGRETGLRTLQPLMYLAGANGTMVGNYLTTSGRDPEVDRQEIIDLGLTT